MSRDTIRELRNILRGLLAERREIDEKIASLEQTIALFEGREATGRGQTKELTDAIHTVLTNERPLHRRVILDRVSEMGVIIANAQPLAYMAAYLSTDPRFINVGRGIWTLATDADGSEILDGDLGPDDSEGQ